MKKLFSLFLALALLCSCASSLAAGYDMSYIRENSEAFTVDVDEDVAFVESVLSASERSFVHKYESDYRYSSTMFDILVIDYGKSTAYPVPRLWVTYCADEYIYYDSVTFTLDGKDYTFTGISDPDWRSEDEKGVIEEVLIKFGTDNLEFLAALQDYRGQFASYDELMDEVSGPKVKMVLHGSEEDIPVTLGGGFMLDFALIIEGAYMETGGPDYSDKVYSSSMTVTSSLALPTVQPLPTKNISVGSSSTAAPSVLSPKNGEMFVIPDYKAECPFTVIADSSTDYYIYLEYQYAPATSEDSRTRKTSAKSPYEPDIAFYLKAGQQVEIDVPIGVYKLYYATGNNFYGTTLLFGDNTLFYSSDDLLSFYSDTEYYHGHTITLIKKTNGNFDTDPIPRNQFPTR